jgi:hypothetical protein
MGRAQEPAVSRATAPLIVSAAQHLRVLVAEDNAVNQKVALMLLQKMGVNADLAGDGAQAIAAVLVL